MMFVIRQDQLIRLERFRIEEQLLSHLNEFFPAECRSLGEHGVRELIGYGFRRAESYGFGEADALCRYVDIMVAFGRDFDREQAWAREVLNDPGILDPDIRIEELSDAAMDALDDDTTEIEPEVGEDDGSGESTP